MLYPDMRIISLNSQFSTPAVSTGDYLKSYLSNVLFNTNDVLRDDATILYSTVALHQCQIPVSWYNINYTCNTLRVSVNGVQTALTMTKANYSVTSLITHLKALFLTLSTPITMTIALDRPTGKLTFSNSVYNFSFLSTGSTALEFLGFDSVVTYTSTNFVLVADHPASLLGIKLLKICSSALHTNAIASNNGYSFSQLNILGIIPVNTGPYTLLSYHNLDPIHPLLTARSVDQIDIQIFDENNRYVNLNNTEWSISLAITSYRKLPDFNLDTISSTLYTRPEDTTTEPVDPPPVAVDRSRDLDFLLYEKGINV